MILAGGSGSRFVGGDKRLAQLGGRPLLEWVAERARPQVGRLVLNANDAVPPIGLRLESLADEAPGAGPLAGILAALREAERGSFTHVASFACDTPFFPGDVVARMSEALRDADADYASARTVARKHRIFALWPAACRARLGAAFAAGARSMQNVELRLRPVWAEFGQGDGPGNDPFFNINTGADLETAQNWIAGRPSHPSGIVRAAT